MAPPLDLRTERLHVRPWRRAEAPRLLDIQSRIEVVRWLSDDEEPELMRDLAQAEQRVARYEELSAEPPLGFWAVEEVATGQVAGSVLLLELPNAEDGEVEIGWHLHPDSWGRGIASEAARAVLGHAFDAGLAEVNAVTHLDNWPSQGVCRRIGMTDRGYTEKWYPAPSQHFAITREEFLAARP